MTEPSLLERYPDDVDRPDKPVHPITFDGCLTLQFQTRFDEERDGGREILDHIPGVIHPFDSHVCFASRVVGRFCRGPSPEERNRAELLDIVTREVTVAVGLPGALELLNRWRSIRDWMSACRQRRQARLPREAQSSFEFSGRSEPNSH